MASHPASTSDNSSTRPSKAFSCVRCFERKVKCNKEHPCSACIRSKVDCVFRNPAPARRRKKRTHEDILQARIIHYESILKSHGLNPTDALATEDDPETHEEDHENDTARETDPHDPSALARLGSEGQLYVDRGKTTFLENCLWSSLSGEIDQPRDLMPESSDDEANDIPMNDPFRVDLVLGYTPTTVDIASLHPPPDIIFKLWQIFLENVNPLTKIIHQPTVQAALYEAASQIGRVKRTFEPLMFAIYSTALTSLTDAECHTKFGDYRINLLARYSLGMRQALMRARFLGTGELSVLQAYALYLFAMRPFYRARTVWVLAGVATRIAQGMGLHRDGISLGLPVFESEMRRRVWWQIAILDYRSAELTGSAVKASDFMGWDTKIPLNVNDSELYPGMKEPPEEHIKPTEMTGCLIRYSLGDFRRQKKHSIGKQSLFGLGGPRHTMAEADSAINELEQLLEEKYLRYLDPSSPTEFHASIVGRAAINMMRLMAHHPLHYDTEKKDPSQIDPAERELLFNCALKVIECDNLVHSTKSTQRFLWHVHVYFQWHAFIYLLSDLRTRTEGDQADKAWKQVEESFDYHPDFITENRRALYIAVCNLGLKAWTARERALARQARGFMPPEPPPFIVLLRRQRADPKPFRGRSMNNIITPPPTTTMPMPEVTNESASLLPTGGNEQLIDPSFDVSLDFSPPVLADTPMSSEPMDWSQWDNLLQEFDLAR